MRYILSFILVVTIVIQSSGQTIKFQAGVSISKLDWELTGKPIEDLFGKTLTGYSALIGVDYLEKRYFNLSSNAGMVRKGGKGEVDLVDENGNLIGETITEKSTLDYLTINTTFDLKYPVGETFTPFISIGPRFDYLVAYSDVFDDLKEIDELNSSTFGLLLGLGMRYDLLKVRFGLRADYYLNFSKVAEWTIEETQVDGMASVHNFTINMTLGYKLK